MPRLASLPIIADLRIGHADARIDGIGRPVFVQAADNPRSDIPHTMTTGNS